MSSKSFNESCKLSDELLSISGQSIDWLGKYYGWSLATRLHQLTIQRSPLQLNSRQLPCILTLQEPPYDLGDGENSSSLHIYGLRPSDTVKHPCPWWWEIKKGHSRITTAGQVSQYVQVLTNKLLVCGEVDGTNLDCLILSFSILSSSEVSWCDWWSWRAQALLYH